MAGITAADLQYILNTITLPEYQKAFGLDTTFFSRVKLVQGKGRIQVPIHYGGNTSASSFGENDDISGAGKQSRRMIEFPYKRVRVTTGVDGLQEAIARAGGVVNINDLITDENTKAIEDLLSEINTQLLGDGTGNSGKDIQGVLYHIADSGNYAVESLDRSIYTWLASYVNDNGGTLRSLSETLMKTVNNILVDERKSNYSAIWTSSTIYDVYEELMGDRRRYVDTQVGDLTFRRLEFKQRPIIPIPGYPANRMDFVQEKDFEVHYLPQVSIDSIGRKVTGIFKVEPLSQNTDSTSFKIVAYLNLICKNPWKQGSLQDIQ